MPFPDQELRVRIGNARVGVTATHRLRGQLHHLPHWLGAVAMGAVWVVSVMGEGMVGQGEGRGGVGWVGGGNGLSGVCVFLIFVLSFCVLVLSLFFSIFPSFINISPFHFHLFSSISLFSLFSSRFASLPPPPPPPPFYFGISQVFFYIHILSLSCRCTLLMIVCVPFVNYRHGKDSSLRKGKEGKRKKKCIVSLSFFAFERGRKERNNERLIRRPNETCD